jgi:RimJ/RimL family protein N-acetyltransferase
MAGALRLPHPPLSNEPVVLRPWATDDLPGLLTAAADPLVHRYRYSLPSTGAESAAWLDSVERDRRRGARLELAVCDLPDPTAVGSVSLHAFRPRNGTAMISYWLAPVARGRGMASRAVQLLAGWGFGELGLARLEVHVEAENAASRHVAERCGFALEGRLRSDQRLRDGSRADVLVFGLLSGELTGDGAGQPPDERLRR